VLRDDGIALFRAAQVEIDCSGSSGVGVEGGADFVDVGAVDADGFVEDLGGDAELVGPVGHVGGDLGIDVVGVVGTFGVLFVGGVGLVGFGCVVVLGHAGLLFSSDTKG
jgi:hypothetical protein